MMHKDVRKLIRDMKREGWEVSIRGSGHVRLTHPCGEFVTTSLTPSDNRTMRNVRADLRRLERKQGGG